MCVGCMFYIFVIDLFRIFRISRKGIVVGGEGRKDGKWVVSFCKNLSFWNDFKESKISKLL